MRRFRKKYKIENSYDKLKLKEEQKICVQNGISRKKDIYILKSKVRNDKRNLLRYGVNNIISNQILLKLWNLGVKTEFFTSLTGSTQIDYVTYYELVLNDYSVQDLLPLRLQSILIARGLKVNESRNKIITGFVKLQDVKKDESSAITIRSPNFLVRPSTRVLLKS